MEYRDEDERLVAELAIAQWRELRQVMKQAPHGKGLATLEQAVRQRGQEQMRCTLQRLLGLHEEAQKRGSTAGPAPVADPLTSSAAAPSSSLASSAT